MIQLINDDCLRVLPTLEAGSVDAVVTDPPYLRKFIYLYEELAKHLPRVLKRGGSLLAIVPQYGISEIVPTVSQYLKWRWMCCMWQMNGKHPRLAMGIEVVWKPIGWWVNEAWPQGRGFVRDGYDNIPVNKQHHEWEQDKSWSDYCMKFIPAGGIVLDPFMGSGTAALSCIETGRSFIGIEREPEYFAIAKRRIEEVQRRKHDQPVLLEVE